MVVKHFSESTTKDNTYIYIVHIDVSTPSKSPPFSFLPRPLLNLQTVQATLSRQSLPVYCFFREPPFQKSDFSVNPHNIKIF